MLITTVKYVNKFVPDVAAISLTRALAAMTQRPPVTRTQQEAMAHATKLSYGDDEKNVAWSWGEGPPIVFVHGWGGRAAQMAPLAASVASLGFRAVALDVTGHGDSPKRHTRWDYFLRDVPALARSLGGEIFAYVGHSAGALSMMAARSLKGIGAPRYVCICAPSYPFPPINVLKKKLDPKPAVLDGYKDYIAEQFDTTWERLQTGCSFANPGPSMLLIYDETDRFVDHTEGDRIHALWPASTLLKTNRYSHLKILEAPEVIKAVSDFLKKERGKPCPA